MLDILSKVWSDADADSACISGVRIVRSNDL